MTYKEKRMVIIVVSTLIFVIIAFGLIIFNILDEASSTRIIISVLIAALIIGFIAKSFIGFKEDDKK